MSESDLRKQAQITSLPKELNQKLEQYKQQIYSNQNLSNIQVATMVQMLESIIEVAEAEYQTILEVATFLQDQIEKLEAQIADITLLEKGLTEKYEELLKGEEMNYDAAKLMRPSSEREELLTHTWGRIKLLKDILEELERLRAALSGEKQK